MTDKQKGYLQKFYERHPDYLRNYHIKRTGRIPKPRDGRSKNPEYLKTQKKKYDELHKEDYRKKYLATRTTLKPCPGYTLEQRRAMNRIRWRTNRYMKYHGIKRPCCQMCDCEDSQIHHPDYSKTFIVNFLCRKCHSNITYRGIAAPEAIELKVIGDR